jgi:hypothetical protein
MIRILKSHDSGEIRKNSHKLGLVNTHRTCAVGRLAIYRAEGFSPQVTRIYYTFHSLRCGRKRPAA